MSLLTIVSGACQALSLQPPSTVIGNTDLTAAQLLSLLSTELDEVQRRHKWSNLIQTVTHTFLSGEVSTNSIATVALPSDFEALAQDTTLYHVQRRREIIGPMSSREWQLLTVGNVPTSVCYWRRVGTNLLIAGVGAGESFTYDYQSKYTVLGQDGTTRKATFTADTDTALIDEGLLKLALVWRFRHAKGLDYAEDMSTYERALERIATDDRGETLRERAMTDRGFRSEVLMPPIYVQSS